MNQQSGMGNVSATAQCKRLLERLRRGPINSFEIADELNICRPGARISELRGSGHNIHTRLADLTDANGYKHPRVAIYSLLSEAAAA